MHCKIVVRKHIVYNYISGYLYNSSVPRSLSVPQSWIDIRMSKTTDIYLAGDSGDDIRWKEDIAIPLIKWVKYILSKNY